jgi:hypothetical protein
MSNSDGEKILDFIDPKNQQEMANIAAQILEMCQGMTLNDVVTRLSKAKVEDKEKN